MSDSEKKPKSAGAGEINLPDGVGVRLAELITRFGTTASAVSRDAGLPRDAVRDIIAGRSRFPRADTLVRIAGALGIDVLDLFPGKPTKDVPRAEGPAEVELPIRYEVAAGQWLAHDDLRDEPYGVHKALRIKGLEDVPQWLERVRGDSMNKRLPDGALIHVVDAIGFGYEPRNRDLVVVVRSRAQGAFLERSVKEVEVTTSGVQLWPRSFNPIWDKPLHLTAGAEDADDVSVQIVGVVATAYIETTVGLSPWG